MQRKKNRRRHPRIPMQLPVVLRHMEWGELHLQTKNISEGGLYVKIASPSPDMCDELVEVQLQKPVDAGEDLPMVPMQIVRVADDGIGLKVMEPEDD